MRNRSVFVDESVSFFFFLQNVVQMKLEQDFL